MASSSGKSTGSRWAICSGLHAVAHRRSARRGLFRPFDCGVTGPTAGVPLRPLDHSGQAVLDVVTEAVVGEELAVLGRRAINSAFHCAIPARYSSRPERVAALCRNSREIVEGALLSRRAISRMPTSCARSSAISSRSANDRYLPDHGPRPIEGMPPRSRNHRDPTGPDTPHATAASSLLRPSAIPTQNARSTSRRAGGRPGDRIAGRPVPVVIPPAGRPISTPVLIGVLRRPVESAQYTSYEFGKALRASGLLASMGRVGSAFDNAMAESVFATLKTELIYRRSWPTRHELEMEVFSYLEGFYNTRRRHSQIGRAHV